jgi:hypothetical protein
MGIILKWVVEKVYMKTSINCSKATKTFCFVNTVISLPVTWKYETFWQLEAPKKQLCGKRSRLMLLSDKDSSKAITKFCERIDDPFHWGWVVLFSKQHWLTVLDASIQHWPSIPSLKGILPIVCFFWRRASCSHMYFKFWNERSCGTIEICNVRRWRS